MAEPSSRSVYSVVRKPDADLGVLDWVVRHALERYQSFLVSSLRRTLDAAGSI
jgi:hypothetical protein